VAYGARMPSAWRGRGSRLHATRGEGRVRHRPSASPPASPVSGHAVRRARAARWGPPQPPAARRRAAHAGVGTHAPCTGAGQAAQDRVGSSGVPRGDRRWRSGGAMQWRRRGAGWAGA
jgi:hypothetical protein